LIETRNDFVQRHYLVAVHHQHKINLSQFSCGSKQIRRAQAVNADSAESSLAAGQALLSNGYGITVGHVHAATMS
jgi:hypothetical protein